MKVLAEVCGCALRVRTAILNKILWRTGNYPGLSATCWVTSPGPRAAVSYSSRPDCLPNCRLTSEPPTEWAGGGYVWWFECGSCMTWQHWWRGRGKSAVNPVRRWDTSEYWRLTEMLQPPEQSRCRARTEAGWQYPGRLPLTCLHWAAAVTCCMPFLQCLGRLLWLVLVLWR